MWKGKSALFWILMAAGASCAVCSGLSLVVLVAAGSSGDSLQASDVQALPRGETPDLFPGSPGFLPSGRGVQIPDAELVDGQPQGLWWR